MTSLNPLDSVGEQITEAVKLHRNVGKAKALDWALEMRRRGQIADAQRRIKEYPSSFRVACASV